MKRGLIISTILLLSIKGFGQLFTFSFGATTACVTDGNSVTTANATVTPFTRVNLTCVNGNFNNSNWNISTTAPVDANSLTKYIEVTITPASGYQISLSSANFFAMRSTTGPTTGWVTHNLSGNFNDNRRDFEVQTTAITSSANQVFWDYTDFIISSAITFRIYAWGLNSAGGGVAATSGTMRIDKFSLSGAVTPIGGNSGNNFTPFTFDQTNGLAGLGKIPTQKLDVVGNIRTSGKLFVGSINDLSISTLTDYSLAVNGNAIFNKVKVKLYGTWPDYVFADDYKLPSFSSLENYIRKYKHLPDVPSAVEVEKNGIDISESQSILLKKIEEVTLYLIELNKKVEALTKENELLKKKVNSNTK